MFYFSEFNEQKVLKSDYLDEITSFFTLRDENVEDVIPDNYRKIKPEQVHGNNVETVNERTEYPNTDGLILKDKNTAIYLRFADCTPLVFYNPKTKTGAISHAGWRGTASKIGAETVLKMGGNPKDIIAVIGPAIGLCCYEVSDDVKNSLISTVKDNSNLYNRNNVDLKAINAQQLREVGVEKMDICPYCTSCNNDLFYSYRKENGTKQRHFAVMLLG